MDAAQALADLTEISSQIEAAVLYGEQGEIAGSTLADEARAEELAGAAHELLEAAESLGSSGAGLNQLEASTLAGSVFVVRDGRLRIVATTGANPTIGLVFYDLKSCLRAVAEQDAKPPAKRTRRRAKRDEEPAAPAPRREPGDAA